MEGIKMLLEDCDGSKLYIPEAMRQSLIKSCHEGHRGRIRTTKMAMKRYFWPGMAADLVEVIKNYPECNKFSNKRQQVKEIIDPEPAAGPNF